MGAAEVDLTSALARAGVVPGQLAALVVEPRVGFTVVAGSGHLFVPAGLEDAAQAIGHVDEALRPRWVLWSGAAAGALVRAGVRMATCWDIAAVHRIVFGGWRADPALVWARLHGLEPRSLPSGRPPDLFSLAAGDLGDPEDPVGPDGQLRPDWAEGGWSSDPVRLIKWAELALTVATLQHARLAELPRPAAALSAARSESAAELLCAELSVDGLPFDRRLADGILARLVGPPPASPGEAAAGRAARDAEVLRHAPAGVEVDLRSPAQVRTLLGRIGVDVPDTRAGRLRALGSTHPLVDALLAWRKAERVATTYGYGWLDEHLGADGRLRGTWTGCDGAAGRMTASGGLHNMPGEMRAAVVAEAGYVFARADLGQIEPRVLATVSGDAALARAGTADDMYAPVAAQLGVDRPTAKVAVLGAMYGQTTGHGAQALRRLEAAYPVAMAYLEDASRRARAGHDLRTYGGRLIPMGSTHDPGQPEPAGRVAARGRYGRNALIQGAAAELFKVWAVTVRARIRPLGGRIVLCLHDELLVHVPVEHGHHAALLLDECLQEAAHRWAPDGSVRFIAETSVIRRWSDAKPAPVGSGPADRPAGFGPQGVG